MSCRIIPCSLYPRRKTWELFSILGCPLIHILMTKSAKQIKYWDSSEEPLHLWMRGHLFSCVEHLYDLTLGISTVFGLHH